MREMNDNIFGMPATAREGDLRDMAVDAPEVLFVDDELSALLGVKRTLRHHTDIKAIDCPLAALNHLVTARNVAVIVSDLQMPQMDGLTFLKEAKALHPNASLVILTGSPSCESAIEAINEVEVARYLMKPCRAPDLVDAIMMALRNYDDRLASGRNEIVASSMQQTLSTFKHAVFHEMRSPLQHILESADQLVSGGLAADQMGDLVINIKRGCSKIDDAADRITDYFKLCSLPEPNSMHRISVAGLLDHCRQHLAVTAPRSGVQFSFISDTGPETIVGDKSLLLGAVTTLVSNALLFSRKGDSLRLELRASETALHICLSNETAGEAIAYNDPKVVEINRSLHRSRSRLGELGLALSYAREVARLHGGELQVEENRSAGRNADVELIIPLAAPGTGMTGDAHLTDA